jgi:gliding motility-associated-like protein
MVEVLLLNATDVLHLWSSLRYLEHLTLVLRHITLLVIALLASVACVATHIVGGELVYTHVSGNNYQISLTVYRDCSSNNENSTGFDASANVTIYRADGTRFANLDMELSSAVVNEIPVALENPCFILPPDVCVERATYTQTVNLPPLAGGYTFSYSRCCSNGSVVNIQNPQGTGITLTNFLPGPETNITQNNSPQFNNLPSVGMCLGAEYTFDHSATDDDGDSIVYTFCDPYRGGTQQDPNPNFGDSPPFSNMQFVNGYSATDPLPSVAPFQINPQTGSITGIANQLGMYVVCICASDYRNGVYLSTTRRTFQFRVTNCDPSIVASFPSQPSLPPSNLCEGLTQTFENNSTNGTDFHWDFGIPNTLADTSNLESPTFSFPAAGVYNIMLVANPSWPCADTAFQTYTVYEELVVTPSFDAYECLNERDTYSFSATTTGTPSQTLSWNFGPGSIPATSSLQAPQNVILNNEVANHTISVTLSDHGCTASSEIAVVNTPDPLSGIAPQEEFCAGLTVNFESTSSNAQIFNWEFNAPFASDDSELENPTISFPASGTYSVRLIAGGQNACPDTSQTQFIIYPELQPEFEVPPAQCLQGNSFTFEADGFSSNSPQVSWNFGSNSNISTSQALNPQGISFSSADRHEVTLTISENGCTESYTDSVWVAANPTVSFQAENTEGCPGLGTVFTSNTTSETPLGYMWDFGDGASAISADAIHVYDTPGLYDVTLTIFSMQGCVTTLSSSQFNLVYVAPLPVPGFTASTGSVDILNPFMTILDESVNAVSCVYTMSDGGTSTDFSLIYEWTEAGRQTITQTVTNESGCVASLTKNVDVTGYLFYAPTSFTPNGDGQNEIWIPVTTGIAKYKLFITNRWGEKVWETDDVSKGWYGQGVDPEYFVQDGVYLYHIWAEDLVGLPHEHKGVITIVR